MGKNMSKSEHTKIQLLKALERICLHKPERISPEQKLSVRAVEDEAGLGDGSAYYYKDIIKKIRDEINRSDEKAKFVQNELETTLITKLRNSLQAEKRLKEKYRMEIIKLRKQLSLMAAQHNSMTLQIQLHMTKIAELESHVVKISD